MQEYKMIEVLDQFQCREKHNQLATIILLDPKLNKNERFLCQECYDNLLGSKNMSLKAMQKIIEDQLKKKRLMIIEIVDSYINVIQQYTLNLENFKTKLVSAIEKAQNATQNWIRELIQKKEETDTYSFIDESENYIKNQKSYLHQFSFDFIDKINSSQFIKLKQGIKDLIQSHSIHQFKEFFVNLMNIKQNRKQVETLDMNEKQEKVEWKLSKYGNIQLMQLNNSIKQENMCKALAFNFQGNILASTNESEIIIWDFDQGKLNFNQKLQQTSFINCLIFSKKQNSLISCSQYMVCWKLIELNQWQPSQSYKSSDTLCIVLNSKEDELILGCKDTTINIWAIDFQQNKLQYLQSLNKHTSWVSSLSFNLSGNFLVSSGFDNQILLWQKDQDNKWIFMNQIKTQISNDGSKVQFFQNDKFIWFTGTEKCNSASIFQQKQQEFIQIDQIQFKTNSNIKDQIYQSIIYNPERNLMFLRYKTSIYILRLQENSKFQIATEQKYSNNVIQGTMSNNGQYLVIHDQSTKLYITYELKDA
ncbi:unnamed protein product [Paramecium sonneborni]|uniref:WD40-repeat-containing domain n=1 Tax=Paramecium sonneborni TaxID=65129 RepID=A0A8S1R5B2_9CILI|nr:unnamed protein product [Paramecium sonneborni]